MREEIPVLTLEQIIKASSTEVSEEYQPKILDFMEAPGIVVKSILLPRKESVVPQHSHKYGHLTMLAQGEIFVWKDGSFQDRKIAPAGIFIPPNTKHTFVTLVDNVLLYCIHRVDEGEQEIEIVEEHQIKKVT